MTACTLEVTVQSNVNPAALGCDLLDPALPADAALGYPVCRASIHTDLDGYAAAFGWIQVVRSTDTAKPDEYDIDPLALFRDVATPFAFFGIKPLLFDAPFRDQRYDLGWEAQAFLCEVPDGVMSHKVCPIVGFWWGFNVAGGSVTIHPARALDLAAWNGHQGLLAANYPDWSFDAAK
ncbi:MAG TPA: hypothetical protein VIC82_11495 [Candidatus Nanopelagicales bacterium]